MPEKSILFFGAGTSAFLKVPTTEKQNNFFRVFFFDENKEIINYINEEYGVLDQKDIDQLLQLKVKMKETVGFVKDMFLKNSFKVMDLYNLIDMSVSENRGFITKNNNKYYVSNITEIRNNILTILQVLFGMLENNILKNKQNDFLKLKDFFKSIAEIEISKRRNQLIGGTIDLQSKEFLFTDIGYVNTNWDVFILWAMLLAHKELNNENKNYIPDKCGIAKLKVFNDFFTYLNSMDINESSNKDWFPYNQAVAYRINDVSHISDRRIILFPTYFPHGQTHWLECPICGKLTMYIDKNFQTYSSNFAMYKIEKLKCSHCYNDLELSNSSMLLQTNYKVKSPYIEEIQRSMRIAINKCDKLIFIGYSLPQDDIEYNSIFRISSYYTKKVYLVLYKEGCSNEFISAQEAKKICFNTEIEKTIQRYCDIFEEDLIMVNLSGFPASMSEILKIIKQ